MPIRVLPRTSANREGFSEKTLARYPDPQVPQVPQDDPWSRARYPDPPAQVYHALPQPPEEPRRGAPVAQHEMARPPQQWPGTEYDSPTWSEYNVPSGLSKSLEEWYTKQLDSSRSLEEWYTKQPIKQPSKDDWFTESFGSLQVADLYAGRQATPEPSDEWKDGSPLQLSSGGSTRSSDDAAREYPSQGKSSKDTPLQRMKMATVQRYK